VLTAALLVT
jgi:hypothetical protein